MEITTILVPMDGSPLAETALPPAIGLAREHGDDTGQLDSETGRGIMELISRLVHEDGMTAVVTTHDPALLALADRVVELVDGRLVSADPR